METKQIVLLLGLVTAFIFIYFMHVGSQCPVRPFVTQEETEGLNR